VYSTMSGSEDLVVFDLSRALPIDSRSPKAQGSEGAKAVQIFRHLPGENPRGIVVNGKDIYVQNAMSLDLSRLTTGGSGPFARVSVVEKHFAGLVTHDPVAPAVRRGERLFNLGNTTAFPKAPMTGDNWMSCSSCHVDGFNYTNQYLFRDTPVDKFHSAFTGHGSLKTLVAGDFIGDYIRMVRNTQGGMGADTRFPTPNTDPDKPSPAVVKMMRDLHAFVTSPGNLPLLSTWLRGEGGTGSVDPKDWTNPALCESCHSRIFKDWANSMHRLMGQSNPYYVVMEDLAAKTEGEPFRAWCMGCHAPQASLSGEQRTTGTSHLFDRNGASLITQSRDYVHAIDEGTGCLFCHRVEKIEDAGATAGANGSVEVSLENRPRYPNSAAVRWFADRTIRALPQKHVESYMPMTISTGRLCSTCHEEFAPGTGAYIMDTYRGWKNSSFNAPNNPAQNRTCMDCHMHASVAEIGTAVPGRATDGGPIESNVVTHQFVGGQYQLVGLRDPELRMMSIALLKSAAKLEIRLEKKDRLVVRVRNVGAGHDLPGGVSNFRQMWLRIQVTDAKGKVVLSSGNLSPDSTLDPKARLFQKKLGDVNGNDIGMAFWRFAKMLEDTRIPARGYRDETFDLPPGTAFPVKADIRLMFRTYPRWLTNLVRKRFPDLPAPKPVEMTGLTETLAPS
jgi:hypothetical protein